MFAIITSILGLSLTIGAGVSGLALLTPVYRDAIVKLEVARDLNEGSQIEAAIMLRSFDALGRPAASQDPSLVVGGYLKELPPGWTLTAQGPEKSLTGERACAVLNEAGGGAPQPCPPCPATASPSLPACLAAGLPVYRPA